MNNLPPWAKAIFVFLMVVAGIGGFQFLETNSQTSTGSMSVQLSPSLKEINILIRDRNNQKAIESVNIMIISDGPPVSKMTDRNGYVKIEIPERKTVEVTLQKNGYKTVTESLNLETDPNTTRTLYMDLENP
ncbi:MAG: hypothetical protein J7519_14035 [Roseofilum sp. SID1]|nr:hypothetical protein [Roseofilum sp. SID1]